MKILTAEQMRAADYRTIHEIGIPGIVLMENAGRAVAAELERRYAERAPGPVLILCGKGNNGGDGLVVARTLLQTGWEVIPVVLAAEGTISGDPRLYLDALRQLETRVEFVTTTEDFEGFLQNLPLPPALIVDAILGTGLSSPVNGFMADVIDRINRLMTPTVAIDLPSGIDATTGGILGTAVQADLTISLAAAKLGQVIYPGLSCCGEVVVAEIGVPETILAEMAEGILLQAEDVRHFLPLRPENGHKGSFGHLLVVAGSCGKTGAAVLTADAALRSGAGLVTVAAPQSVQPTLAIKLTEAMTCPLEEEGGEISSLAYPQLRELWQGKKGVAIGPCLGRSATSAELIRRVVEECPLPLVIDADALMALCGHLHLLAARPVGTTILTPHPGEMAALLGLTIAEVENDRVGAAIRFAETHGVILVLKGARTIIAAPDGGIMINPTGHAGMATGGMGDLLTGIIAALLVQGAAPLAAAAAGVWLHGASGDRLRSRHGNAGLLASDLLYEIPAARCDILESSR